MIEIEIECQKCSEKNQILLQNLNASFKCKSCNRTLFDVRKVDGYIYVLSNPAIPDLLKIGFTERSVEERVTEINRATGVPADFIVEATFLSENPELDEKKIHKNLAQHRTNKEFFEIEPHTAILKIKSLLNKSPHKISKAQKKKEQEQEREQEQLRLMEQEKKEREQEQLRLMEQEKKEREQEQLRLMEQEKKEQEQEKDILEEDFADPEKGKEDYSSGLVYKRSGNGQMALKLMLRAARMGHKKAQDFLSGRNIDWERDDHWFLL